MKSIYQENRIFIQEGLKFVTKILGLECVLTTGGTMELLSPMLHATQWDILLAVKVTFMQCKLYFMKDIIIINLKILVGILRTYETGITMGF